jgi:ATP-dependent DNA helicase DinG
VTIDATDRASGASTEGDADPALAHVLGPGGTLARTLPGYRFRAQQLAMAEAVAATIASRGQLVAEAGTGTGKTFAYLVPALLYGGKVIVSTGTKTLQDQLFERDLPLIRDALALPVSVAVLKGRANYVCHYYLERTAREGRLPSRDDARHLPRIVQFAQASVRGDRAELADVPENATIWPLVTSTRENCLGSSCPFHEPCFVQKARKDALDADVVVVNHHLFFADVMLRDEGLAELLPNCNTVILDEAHQLPDTATLFFGEQISGGQLADLARDAEVAARSAARDVPELPDAAADITPALRKLRLAAGDAIGKFAQDVAAARPGFLDALSALAAAVDRLASEMQRYAERSDEIAQVARRAEEIAGRLARWQAGLPGAGASPAATLRAAAAPTLPSPGTEGVAGALRADTDVPDDDPDAGWIRWVDVSAQSFQLHASPLSVANIFRRQVQATGRAWIFTSATLAVGRNFSHYTGQLGLGDAATGCWESPFDYASQALLYVPRGLPAPNSREHTEAIVDAALPILRASGGRAFLLFTTLRALNVAHDRLAAAFAREHLDFPILVQGSGSKTELLTRFRTLGNAVLLGSASFWEGVDVPGDALSVVVIDKLPFAPPDDPLLAARLARLEADGGNPFMDWQLPLAAFSL